VGISSHNLPFPDPALAIVGVVLATCAASAAVRLVRECLCAATATGTSGRLILHPLRIWLVLWAPRWRSASVPGVGGRPDMKNSAAAPAPLLRTMLGLYHGTLYPTCEDSESLHINTIHTRVRTHGHGQNRRKARRSSARSLVAVDVHCMYFSYTIT